MSKRMRWGLVILIAIGYWLRIRGLGALSLWGDEAYQALSIKGILSHGVPLLPTGVLYLRSIPFQYVEALSVWILGMGEFGLRFPSVIFNLLTIPIIYLLGKEFFNKEVGVLAAIILCFSLWEIEMARFARMYTCFQFFYVLGLWTFYRGYIKGDRRWQIISFCVFFLTLLSHQLGIFLLSCYLIPLFIKGYQVVQKKTLILLMVILGVPAKGWAEWSYQSSYAMMGTPPDNHVGWLGFIGHMFMPMKFDLVNHLMLVGGIWEGLFFVGLGILCVITLYHLVRFGVKVESFLTLGIVFFSVVHQFGVVFILLALLMLMGNREQRFFSSALILVIIWLNGVRLDGSLCRA
jgi:4-amino-4-deoxy-L-arabinose transferase-like glycosyltransferase